MWILGLKGLISVPGAFGAYTKITHRNGRNQNTKKKNDRMCFGKGTEQNRKLIEKKKKKRIENGDIPINPDITEIYFNGFKRSWFPICGCRSILCSVSGGFVL